MQLLLLLPLIPLIISDWKYRIIYVWNLALFGLMSFGIAVWQKGLTTIAVVSFQNLLILGIIGCMTGLYIYFRYGKSKKMMGGGDMGFILLLTPVFTNMRTFVIFLIISSALSLTIWHIFKIFGKTTGDIPLVSGIGICYSVLLIFNSLFR